MAAVGFAATQARAQSIENSDTPPARFVRAWQEAAGGIGTSQKEAIAALAANPTWEPYFRSAFNRTTDQTVRDRLRPTLQQCRADRLTWNLERSKTWAKELRLDYLTSFGSSTDDPEAAAI